jgi:choline dehydrogenase-like flavoprotein
MRIVDLRQLDSLSSEATADVCIVGAGAAGLVLAVALARAGVRVAILEAGQQTCVDGSALGIEAVNPDGYGAATKGRVFGLGGTTAVWGGHLVPHGPVDVDAGETPDAGIDFWQHLLQVIDRQAARVLELLGLPWAVGEFGQGNFLPSGIGETARRCGIGIVVGVWLPFRRRNFSWVLRKVGGHAPLDVYLSAPVVDWDVLPASGGRAHIRCVTARKHHRTLRVNAKWFVVAAGAIESTRILLALSQRYGSGLIDQRRAVGRYLSDHISCAVADVEPGSRAACARIFGPRFRAGTMYTFRFVDLRRTSGLPRGFAHFTFEHNNAAFEIAKLFLLSLQRRAVPRVSFGQLASGAWGLGRLGYERFFRSRLYVAEGTPVHLQLDLEQVPRFSNRIELTDRTDATGLPVPVIRWSLHEEDYRAVRHAARAFLERWPTEIGVSLVLRDLDGNGVKPHDVYHPVGTCRMGTDVEAVVDPSLRVHDTENLFVLSTAVFPSAGSANPTFSLLCFALDLAERLGRMAKETIEVSSSNVRTVAGR